VGLRGNRVIGEDPSEEVLENTPMESWQVGEGGRELLYGAVLRNPIDSTLQGRVVEVDWISARPHDGFSEGLKNILFGLRWLKAGVAQEIPEIMAALSYAMPDEPVGPQHLGFLGNYCAL